ncbi:uncharacterized protein PAC_03036 [Phialocephala subalpina]|uniref:Uncharacterized protein n=1 Tax=Phialocephala subalpina TaxID=576137 RepID=A0A1L7WK48_9HELO|nr:uncharacterized protein PAC_03036 [Phialocephala subalpina]
MNFWRPIQEPSPCLSEPSSSGPMVVRFHPLFQQHQHSLHAYHSRELSTATQDPYTSANLYALLFLTTHAMNWTGGRLQRHSNAADNVKQRQKQHFARVQQNLRCAPKFKSPAKWSVFDLIAEDRQQSLRESSVVQLAPKASSREESRSTSKLPARLLPTAHAARKREHNRIKPTPVPDDDLYNATPPPWKYKQERKDLLSLSGVGSVGEQQQEEESMSEKRRRILRRGDWVGVGIQKPLNVAFASPRDEENIGRRRKVLHSHRARYETRQTHITSPFPPRARCPAHIAPAEWARQQQQQAAMGRADVRISTGGRVVPPGLSSSSARTATRYRSQATPSDVMLLDNNDDVFQPEVQQTPSSAVQHYSPFSGSHNHSRDRPSRLTQVHSKSGEAEEEPVPDLQTENSDRFEGWAGFFSPIPNEMREETQDADGPKVGELGETDKPPLSNQDAIPSRDIYNSPLPQRIVYSSSSTSIHHPKPKSSRMSVLIRSDSPEEQEDAQSTAAQIGERKPAVPSSQAPDNEMWESWVGHLFQEQGSEGRSHFGDTRHHQEVNISPGISTVPPRRKFEVSFQEEDLSGFESLEPQICSQKTSTEWQQTSSEQLESPSSRNESREMEKEDLERSRPSDHSEGELASDFQPERDPSHRHSPKTISEPSVSKDEKDVDEVWRKFVFGSSSDGPEEHGPSMHAPAHKQADNQSGLGSSMIARPATRQSVDSAWKTDSWSGQATSGTTNASAEESSHGQGLKYPRRVPLSSSYMKSEKGRSSTMSDSSNLYAPGSYRPNSRARRAPASSAATAGSPLPDRSSIYHAQRRMMFTKPKPFVGRKSKEPSSEEEPLHIGRKLLDDESMHNIDGSRRGEHDVHSFGTSEDQDELESIEDD